MGDVLDDDGLHRPPHHPFHAVSDMLARCAAICPEEVGKHQSIEKLYTLKAVPHCTTWSEYLVYAYIFSVIG